MLVLSRHVDEEIQIGDDVWIKVLAIRGDKVRLGISAPPEVRVDRQEVRDCVDREIAEGRRLNGGNGDA